MHVDIYVPKEGHEGGEWDHRYRIQVESTLSGDAENNVLSLRRIHYIILLYLCKRGH